MSKLAELIFNNRGDVLAFDSEENALRYIEAIDVQNNEYIAYDTEARLMNLSVVRGRVFIERAEEEPTHAAELKEILIQFLKRVYIRKGLSIDWIPKATLKDAIYRISEFNE